MSRAPETMLSEKTRLVQKNSVTHAMTSRVPVVSADIKVADIVAELHKQADQYDTIHYIYLVDKQQRVVGIVTIKDLYRHSTATVARALVREQKIVSVTPHHTQEQAAYAALRHHILGYQRLAYTISLKPFAP